MTAIKHALQRDVFTPNDERLLGVVHVAKTGKKRKSSFLCASVTTEHPVEVYICQIKKQEKGEPYKKQKIWHLKELKAVDGKDSDKDATEFDLVFDKASRWSASSVTEKQTFISVLWKLCRRYLPKQMKVTFTNVPDSMKEVSISGSDSQRTPGSGSGGDGVLEDYQALTTKEESDLERMIAECDYAISNAEKFSEMLSKDLSVLDGENISSIMGSEEQVNDLMSLLDKALNEVNVIEDRLDAYNDMVQSISGQMGQMKNQESFIQITNKNHITLLQELDKLVHQLDLSKGHIKALNEGDLRVDSGIAACTSAAEALQHAMQVELHPGICRLQAVVEQQKLFEDLRQKFAKRLYHFLFELFTKHGNEQSSGGLVRQADKLTLPKHFPYHRDLLPYKDLTLWLKVADKTKYMQLCDIYTQSLNKVYTREITGFIESAKQRFIEKAAISAQVGNAALLAVSSSNMSLNAIGSEKKSKLGLNKKLSSSIKNLSGSSTSLSKQQKKFLGSTQSLNVKAVGKKMSKVVGGKKNTLGVSRESLATSDFELSDREKFSSTFREVLNELEPACQDEEAFLIKFFHLNVETADTLLPGGSDDEEDDTEQGAEKRRQYQETQVTKDIRPVDKKWRMMTEIFSIVEKELLGFVAFGDRLDPLNSLNMLVVIGDRVAKARQDNDGSFLAKMLGNSLIDVKRRFDLFIKNKIDSVQQAHLSKGKKCGILPFVTDFEDFAELAESIFKDSHRRNDLEKAYRGLINAVFNAIERLAGESQKTPREVVMFENYHALHDCLSRLKIVGLEHERKQTKNKYNNNLKIYVTTMMGRPLEKLSTFFEGVEQVMESGVSAEEVSYKLKYSKNELRKCVKEYSGKDVKKGLETLYHKITKHTKENDNRLLRVVWQYMQDEFLQQYKHFEDLIEKCYSGSGIKLEFTINDVLQYFTEIAYQEK